MKRSKYALKDLRGVTVTGLVVLCLLVSSCLKNSSAVNPPPSALITVIHASPNEPAMDFYLNGDRANASPLTYGTGIDYFSALAGQRTANFFNAGSFTPIVASAPITLEQNMAYSLFLDSLAPKPGILLLEDTLVKPITGKAGVRFVDLSPDAPAVDLAIQGGTTITTNKSFKGHSSFTLVTGQSNFTFQVLKHSTSTVLASLTNVSLTNGYLYTVMLEGLNASTGGSDKLTIIMITNAYFN